MDKQVHLFQSKRPQEDGVREVLDFLNVSNKRKNEGKQFLFGFFFVCLFFLLLNQQGGQRCCLTNANVPNLGSWRDTGNF